MDVVLHEGHQHSETASMAISPESVILLALGVLAPGVVMIYAARRYFED
ncbi:MAG: hypothetical protein V5A55_10270 [Halovenus sp.]